ncbi:hypothetical protein Y023_5250 [Burkholderia pseudomallei A79D]|nr:hypothetical protein X992_5217 [Burkholderia pseudomallei MSHR5492]KGX95836.1 hypothetical protein Y023_5250 [Burkholderia pseudomallei A79D]KGX96927.1 hypothetical protein X997_4930 [Burkholderia pseudomallei A79C]
MPGNANRLAKQRPNQPAAAVLRRREKRPVRGEPPNAVSLAFSSA